MSWYIQPSHLKGELAIPPSKSETMRGLLLGAMGKGETLISNPLYSPDTLAMIAALSSLGAKITTFPDFIHIEGVDGKIEDHDRTIDAGNSGLVLRLIGALAGLSSARTCITGDYSIRHRRPVQPLIQGLQALGAQAEMQEEGLVIRGKISPGKARLSGEDSQPVSGLLIATSFLQGPTELIVDDPGETPWIDLTLVWMQKVGLQLSHSQYTFYSLSGYGAYPGFQTRIPADLSSLSFPLVAALVTGSSLTLTGIDLTAAQGDKKIIDLVQQMGARMEIKADQIHIHPHDGLKGIEAAINDCIDALPILAALACYASSPTRLFQAAIARKKESDRIHVMARELSKMGAQIEEFPDGLIIYPSRLKGATVESHSDHRIAMALAVAALGAQGLTHIQGVDCAAKTYPSFARDFQTIGARLEA